MEDTGLALDTSVIDAPAPEETVVDDLIDDGAQPDATGDDTALGDDDETPAPEPPAGDLPPFTGKAVEGGKLNPAIKPYLDKLKADAPALEKQVRNALIRQDILSRDFPGGVTEVKNKIAELQQTVEDLGGEEGIQKTKGELAFFHDLDTQFTAGDPRFIESLIADPAGQESFLKLAPAMISKYESMHPEGFNSMLHSRFMGEMAKSDLKLEIIRMQDFIARLPEGPERAGLEQHWGSIAQFYNNVAAGAAKKPETPKIANAAPVKQDDGREQQLSQREQAIKTQEFETSWNGSLRSAFSPAFDKLKTERGMTDVQASAARELFSVRFQKTLAANPDVQKQIERFYKAGDREGYQRTVKAFFAKEVPKVLSAVVDHLVPAKGQRQAPKPTLVPGRPGAPAAPAAAAPRPIQSAPGIEKVDFNKTTMTMYQAGEAILKTGQKVTWKR